MVMHTVENGISPQSDPDQVFNSLFDETTNEQFIKVRFVCLLIQLQHCHHLNIYSSVTPGPLQDVVIPAEISKDIHLEALGDNMTQLTEKLNAISTVEEAPYVDIFTRVMSDEQKSPKGEHQSIKISRKYEIRYSFNIYHSVHLTKKKN